MLRFLWFLPLFFLWAGFVYEAHVPTSDDIVFERDQDTRSDRIEVELPDGGKAEIG